MPKHKHAENEEVRSFRMEMRAAEDSRKVVGYAALFDEPTDMGWYTEVIARGAFDGADMQDVRILFNHEPSQVLARTASGTATLTVDERGLRYEFEMPDTTLGNDLLKLIRRGDISQSSFAFSIDSQTWTETEGQPDLRTITKVATVYDAAPVTYPAYENTEVALRSKPAADTPKPDTPAGFAEDVAADILFVNDLLRRG